MKLHRSGSTAWSGNLKEGKGAISVQSNALSSVPFAYATRLEGVRGTNPEELLAAAHSACFTMGFVMLLEQMGKAATHIDTKAVVTLEQTSDGFVIPSVQLTLQAKIPDIEEAKFLEIASRAKINCPVSKLFRAEVTLDATLV
jgi:lipoyl-dependent peroxiredoxin